MSVGKDSKNNIHGIIAHFDGPKDLLKAAVEVRKAGYRDFDCHSPFPIHGMDDAMGLRRSFVGWVAGAFALMGGVGAMGLQWWTSAVEYPIIISGKPFFSYQAFVPITFEIAILATAVGAVLSMFALAGLPKLYHHLFYADTFGKFSDDGFIVSIDAKDLIFDAERSSKFLESIGGKQVELVRSK